MSCLFLVVASFSAMWPFNLRGSYVSCVRGFHKSCSFHLITCRQVFPSFSTFFFLFLFPLLFCNISFMASSMSLVPSFSEFDTLQEAYGPYSSRWSGVSDCWGCDYFTTAWEVWCLSENFWRRLPSSSNRFPRGNALAQWMQCLDANPWSCSQRGGFWDDMSG